MKNKFIVGALLLFVCSSTGYSQCTLFPQNSKCREICEALDDYGYTLTACYRTVDGNHDLQIYKDGVVYYAHGCKLKPEDKLPKPSSEITNLSDILDCGDCPIHVFPPEGGILCRLFGLRCCNPMPRCGCRRLFIPRVRARGCCN